MFIMKSEGEPSLKAKFTVFALGFNFFRCRHFDFPSTFFYAADQQNTASRPQKRNSAVSLVISERNVSRPAVPEHKR